MPLPREVLHKYIARTFIETGTYAGDTVQMALDLGFKTVCSIELDRDKAAGCILRFAKTPNVYIYSGSSGDLLPRILKQTISPVTFWLDAHPNIAKLNLTSCPVVAELEAIANIAPQLNIQAILIDDMRLFDAKDQQWMETRLREILPKATICRDSHHIATNDILVAHLLPSLRQ